MQTTGLKPTEFQVAAIVAAIQAYLAEEIRPPCRTSLSLSPWKVSGMASVPLAFTRKSMGWNRKATYNT
tara:strand:- start:593 stop:799 length:207 start_codon:yes stop_codon:yes gene_type:complete